MESIKKKTNKNIRIELINCFIIFHTQPIFIGTLLVVATCLGRVNCVA